MELSREQEGKLAFRFLRAMRATYITYPEHDGVTLREIVLPWDSVTEAQLIDGYCGA